MGKVEHLHVHARALLLRHASSVHGCTTTPDEQLASAIHPGRLVIELYEDLHPIGAVHLRNRCLPGATASLAGTTFHKLLRHYALFGAKK